MGGQSVSTRAQSAISKGGRKKMIKNVNNAEEIQKLMRRLNRKVKRIAKLEQREIEHQNKYSLQLAYLQEKLNLKNKKIVELKKENRRKKQLAIENVNLRKEIDNNEHRLSNQSPSVWHRIQEVIEEIENRYPNVETQPPSDREIKVTVLKILRGADWDTTTMKNLIEMTCAKYSQFDLKAKREFIKSIVKAAVSPRSKLTAPSF